MIKGGGEGTLKVCITGAAGQIAYALLPSLCDGSVFGENKRIELRLLDIPSMMGVLKGVLMELEDCAWTNLIGIMASDDPLVCFQDCDVAILVGAMPRKEGMERKDLLKANAGIFKIQGEALDQVACKNVQVLVVGNPANTNALIVSHYAPSIPKENFSALTRLDENRARALLAAKLGVNCNSIHGVTIWGNHSNTQFPDIINAKAQMNDGSVREGSEIIDQIGLDYYKNDFIKSVQTRGAAVIGARKLSSAMSAAKAIGDHLRDWLVGTREGEWVSMAVYSDGSYNSPKGVFYSFPVTASLGKWKIVKNLKIDEFATTMMKATAGELEAEREEAMTFLKSVG